MKRKNLPQHLQKKDKHWITQFIEKHRFLTMHKVGQAGSYKWNRIFCINELANYTRYRYSPDRSKLESRSPQIIPTILFIIYDAGGLSQLIASITDPAYDFRIVATVNLRSPQRTRHPAFTTYERIIDIWASNYQSHGAIWPKWSRRK
jgi:hypothetical protein